MLHSLQSSLLHFETREGLRVHVIDTPGSPDFTGQALPSLEAVETAVVVIDAQRGIELMAQRMMDAARRTRPRPRHRHQQDRCTGHRPAGPAGADPSDLRQASACR